MTETPSQSDIDAIAYFVEGARELRTSPFFIEEYMSLGISMREGDPMEKVEGRFPDPNVLQSVLVPFRRIWHQSEPCYHARVVNVLKKHMVDCQALLASFRFRNEKSVAKQMPFLRNIDLSPTDVIDLWLNTRYHHVGKSSRNGRFTREDFV